MKFLLIIRGMFAKMQHFQSVLLPGSCYNNGIEGNDVFEYRLERVDYGITGTDIFFNFLKQFPRSNECRRLLETFIK